MERPQRIVQCFGLSNGIELQIREKVQFMADLGLRQEPEICMKWLRDISGNVERECIWLPLFPTYLSFRRKVVRYNCHFDQFKSFC